MSKKMQSLNNLEILQESIRDSSWNFIPLKNDPDAYLISEPYCDEILVRFAILNTSGDVFIEEKIFNAKDVIENNLVFNIGQAAEYFDIVDDWTTDSYIIFGRANTLILEHYFFDDKYGDVEKFIPVGLYYYDPDGNVFEGDFESSLWNSEDYSYNELDFGY